MTTHTAQVVDKFNGGREVEIQLSDNTYTCRQYFDHNGRISQERIFDKHTASEPDEDVLMELQNILDGIKIT